jgi:hypothetical protein
MAAPGVEVVRVILAGPVKLPPLGVMTGVATVDLFWSDDGFELARDRLPELVLDESVGFS